MPTWSAVAEDWTAQLGTAFQALFAGGFIQAGKTLADGHPCTRSPSCGCYHVRAPGTLRMVCTCEEPDCRDFTVSEEMLRIHRLNTLRVADATRRVLSVKGTARRLPDLAGVYALGTYHPAPQASYPVFLLAPSAQGDQNVSLAELAFAHSKRVGIVLLSRSGLDTRLEKSLAEHTHFVFLPESAALTAAGTIQLLPGVKDPLRPIHNAAAPELPDEEIARAMQTAFAMDDEKSRRAGPTMVQYLKCVARGMSRSEIATKYPCRPTQISNLKREFKDRFKKDPEILLGRIGDVDSVAKTIADSRARHIHQHSAATGREEEFDR